MFAAVMLQGDNAKHFLETVLGLKIRNAIPNKEKSIVFNPEFKGVRFDVYIEDENNTRYDIEMQIAKKELVRRTRYYHSEMDMDMLLLGHSYEELSDAYVIFICDYDPFDLGKYRYTLKKTFVEDTSFDYNDGSHSIFLSTVGTNDEEVSQDLVEFLKFVRDDKSVNHGVDSHGFIKNLKKTVDEIKENREIGGRYMVFEELLSEERAEGRAEGKTEGKIEALKAILSLKGLLSDDNLSMVSKLSDICDFDSVVAGIMKSETPDDLKRNISSIG